MDQEHGKPPAVAELLVVTRLDHVAVRVGEVGEAGVVAVLGVGAGLPAAFPVVGW